LLGNYMKELEQLREAPPEEASVLAKAKLRAMEADGFRPNRNVLTLAIGLCSTDLAEAEALFARLAGFPEGPPEGAYMSLLRAQVAEGELDRALDTWEHMLNRNTTPRPRTTSPLLIALCEARRVDAATQLYSHLGQRGLERTEEAYSAMFTMHGALGQRRQALQVLSDMLADFPRPGARAGAAVVELFERLDSAAAAAQGSDGVALTADADTNGESVRASAESATPVDVPPAGAQRVLLDAEGVCPCCGAKLEVLRLSPDECAEVRTVLLARAAERMGEQGACRLRRFAKWLKDQPPFDYVVDGPNVGYAKQNFETGRFEFGQIAALVRLLQRAGKRVLLILPSKYAQDVIPNHTSAEEVVCTPRHLQPHPACCRARVYVLFCPPPRRNPWGKPWRQPSSRTKPFFGPLARMCQDEPPACSG
jgi:proteinaceous RNase P